MKLTVILTVLMLLTACLGQLNRIPVGGGDGVVIYANDLLMAGIVAVYLAHVLIIRKTWIIPWPMAVLAIFMALAPVGLLIGSNMLSNSQVLVSLSYWIRYAAYAFIALIVFDGVVYSANSLQLQRSIAFWLKVLLMASLLMAASGFIQLYVLPDFAELTKYGWDPHIGRLATAMLDPNYAGAYLSIGAIVATSFLLYSTSMKRRFIFGLIAGILILAIILTFSRSAYVMLVVGLAVVAFFKARWLLLVAAVVGIIAFTAVPRVKERVMSGVQIDVTSSIRITSWQNSLTIAMDNQPFGIGFNSYRYAQDRYGIVNQEDSGNAGAGADSSWLFVLATTGAIGFTLFIIFYSSLIYASGRVLLENQHNNQTLMSIKATQLAVVAVLFGLIPASMINNSLFYTWILQLWWVLIGLSLGTAYWLKHQGQAIVKANQSNTL